MNNTDPLNLWRGAFGDAYTDRNTANSELVRPRLKLWAHLLNVLAGAPPRTILEVGANLGLNLRALAILTEAQLLAVEPNAVARSRLVEDGVLDASNVHDGTAQTLPFADSSCDLVFTSGVLIHIPPSALGSACDEIMRVSRRWIIAIEYFADTPEERPYRGHDGALFKRDFGSFWLDAHPTLEPVDAGFAWRRTTGLDNLTWWIFRKTGSGAES